MLLDDALQNLRSARMIPNPFRINDRDRPKCTNAKTIRFRAKNRRLVTLGKLQFFKPILQVFPRFYALFLRAALGLGLVGAEEDVTLDRIDPQRVYLLL